MAFVDPRGLIGRRSLRRTLDELDMEQRGAFQASTSDIDPTRFKSLYRQRARQFLNQEREAAGFRNAESLALRDAERRAMLQSRNFGLGVSGAGGTPGFSSLRRTW